MRRFVHRVRVVPRTIAIARRRRLSWRRAFGALFAPAVLLLVLPHVAAAQVAPGDMIRFTERQRAVRGTVVQVDSTGISILAKGASDPDRYALAAISDPQLRTGTKRLGVNAMLAGAGIGVTTGAVLGGIAGASDRQGEMYIGPAGGALILGFLGLIAGTVVGTVVAVIPAERWESVDLSVLRSAGTSAASPSAP